MFSWLKFVLHKNTTPDFACYFIFNVVTIVFLSNVSIAQSRFKRQDKKLSYFLQNKFEVGLSGGLSLNHFTQEQPQTGFNTGATAGLLVHYKVYKGFGIQLEANWLQQGGQMIRFKDDTQLGLPESFETKNVKNSSYLLNSIEIPLLINYTFKIKQTWKPTLYTGGSFAHNFNVTENYQKTGDLLAGENIIATAQGSQNVTSAFKSNRLNFIVGSNIKLPLYANILLMLDFRYLIGLTTARENYSYMDKAGFGSDVRSNSFISKIGIILPIAKR